MNQIERVLSKELERERSQNESLRERIMELENELNTMRLMSASKYAATTGIDIDTVRPRSTQLNWRTMSALAIPMAFMNMP